jgi:hypothetical protein
MHFAPLPECLALEIIAIHERRRLCFEALDRLNATLVFAYPKSEPVIFWSSSEKES